MVSKGLINYDSAVARLGNDAEMYKMLIPFWFEKKQFDRKELENLESKGNKIECAKYVHAMKGAAGNLGAEMLQSAAQRLENIYRDRETGDREMAISEVERLYEKTNTALKELEERI